MLAGGHGKRRQVQLSESALNGLLVRIVPSTNTPRTRKRLEPKVSVCRPRRCSVWRRIDRASHQSSITPLTDGKHAADAKIDVSRSAMNQMPKCGGVEADHRLGTVLGYCDCDMGGTQRVGPWRGLS